MYPTAAADMVQLEDEEDGGVAGVDDVHMGCERGAFWGLCDCAGVSYLLPSNPNNPNSQLPSKETG